MSDTDPLTGELLAKPKTLPPEKPQEALDLSRLDGMTRDELKTLVRRMARQCGMAAAMTKEETRQAILDRYAAEAINPRTHTKDFVVAGAHWLDREDGKPVQKQILAAKIETRDMTDPTMVKDLARRLDFILANPAVKTLDVDR